MLRQTHGCNSVMNVMRLTNLFLIGLKTRSVRENAFLILKIWPRKGFTNPRTEFINIILLNDHIIKLSTKNISLYTQISQCNSPTSQTSFLHSGWWLTQRLKADQMVKSKDQRSSQPQMGPLYHPPTSSLKPLGKRKQKDCKCCRLWTAGTKQCLLNTGAVLPRELTAAMAACQRPTQHPTPT